MLELFESYVEMFYHAAKITFLFKSYHDIRDIPALEQANREMEEFRIRLEAQLSGTHYPYYVYWLLDTRMLQSFVEDNEQRMLPLRE